MNPRPSIFGSIKVEWLRQNLHITKTHTPTEKLMVERADVDDLMVALDAALETREAFEAKIKAEVDIARDAARRAWMAAREQLISQPLIKEKDFERAFDRYWNGMSRQESPMPDDT